jgi:hypothetical protein
MATTATSTAVPSVAIPRANAAFGIAPWYVWCAVLAVTSALIGAHWDISWHRSIGRDSFWTPAHIAIQMCGVLAGIAFGYLILHTTFSASAPLARASVHIFGFRAPLGAFIASWGGIAMLTSAPFDNWWHNAYGLDVKIVSPPHMVLILGIYGVLLGTVVLLAGHINRLPPADRTASRYLLLYCYGVALSMSLVVVMEYTLRSFLHGSLAYIVLAIPVPLIVAIASRATGFRFAATGAAAFYTLFVIGLVLILPLFPAEPRLGPVFHPVTQFIPPQFPILLIVPAFLLDLLWQRARAWNPWKLAAISAIVFVAALLAVEWPFADFLMSPAAQNRLFGSGYHGYDTPPDSFAMRNLFIVTETVAQFWKGILLATAVAVLTFRFGISRGNWLRAVKR